MPSYTDNPGHLTEFYAGFHGTCGECALEDAFHTLEGTPASEDEMVAITHEMQAHQQADASGATTLYALAREAERRGYGVLLEWDYASPFPHDWHTVLLENAGQHPIILFLENGQALSDIETGAHDEPGLHGHFICVLNKQPDGYKSNDGDNPQVLQRYAVYSFDTLSQAQVSGLLMLQKGSQMPTSTVPAGWSDDGSTLKSPSSAVPPSVPVVHGFRDFILNFPGGWNPKNTPLAPERFSSEIEYGDSAIGKGSRQDFLFSSLGCQQHADSSWGSPYEIATGKDILALVADLAKLAGQTPAPAPVPESVKAALQALRSSLAPQVALAAEVSQACKDLNI